MRFPLATFAIVPTYTYGSESHVASKLEDMLCRDEVRPALTIAVDTMVVVAIVSGGVAEDAVAKGDGIGIEGYKESKCSHEEFKD